MISTEILTDPKLLKLSGAIFSMTFLSFVFLVLVQGSKSKIIRALFHIPARKSTSNAVQLGGLPLSVGISTGFFSILYFFGDQLTLESTKLIKYWLWSSSFIIIYGYLDDKFELRPIFKLLSQLITVCMFALLSSRILFPSYSTLAFLIVSFWGLGVVNGSNLLDGLDTLTIKHNTVTLFFFLFFGLALNNFAVVSVTMITLSALWSFYFFNKEPAKIHLGEIGGSFVGFSYLLSSSLLFRGLLNNQFDKNIFGFNGLDCVWVALLPLSLPMVELGISFLRRIYNKKSPFRGDRFHIHHILRNYHEFSPSTASSLFAGAYGVLLFCGGFLLTIGVALSSYVMVVLSMMLSYLAVGHTYWSGDNTLSLNPKDLFGYLLKKDVMTIDSSAVDDFHFTLIEDEDEDLDEDDDGNEDDESAA